MAIVVVLVLLFLSSVVRLAMVTVISSSSFLFSPHFSHTVLSVNGLQLDTDKTKKVN